MKHEDEVGSTRPCKRRCKNCHGSGFVTMVLRDGTRLPAFCPDSRAQRLMREEQRSQIAVATGAAKGLAGHLRRTVQDAEPPSPPEDGA